MSVIAKLFLVAVLAAVVAAPAPAATPRSELSTYLAAVKPHVAAAARASAAAVRHAEPPLLPEDTVDTTPLRADAAKMGAIAKRVAAIRPPAALREAHASLVRSLKLESAMYVGIANDLDAENLARTLKRLRTTGVTLTDLARHWRAEVTAMLRRFGLAVPLWVKHVGA